MDQRGMTAMTVAIWGRQDNLGKLFLTREDLKADVGYKGKHGECAVLAAACMLGCTEVVKALLERDDMLVNEAPTVLLGITWATNTPHDTSLLCLAALHGNQDVVALPLGHPDIQLDLEDADGCTALARVAIRGHDRIIAMLLERDDSVINWRGSDGNTPIMHAFIEGHNAAENFVRSSHNTD
ncbi:hypothetical protein VTO42DRAFT_8944 [Malbranchea cinnamomea]